ncbi:hypothetical protein UK23_23640 [Lentzea aerocolonigenes]|uniref:Short-chain dehydrogenase n=1 Tax=Lentzea aerocolonigenes TaxID=68170 RepID=A0A0F0GWD3_LENAE|nr:hypothetical protein UK23_23640 [Lentzea aerocolonigenes]
MVRKVFGTNVFGVITVTNAMLPLLRRSPAPRVVNVSSAAGSLTICAAVIVRLATLGTDGPTGGFFTASGPLPW